MNTALDLPTYSHLTPDADGLERLEITLATHQYPSSSDKVFSLVASTVRAVKSKGPLAPWELLLRTTFGKNKRMVDYPVSTFTSGGEVVAVMDKWDFKGPGPNDKLQEMVVLLVAKRHRTVLLLDIRSFIKIKDEHIRDVDPLYVRNTIRARDFARAQLRVVANLPELQAELALNLISTIEKSGAPFSTLNLQDVYHTSASALL